MGRKKKELKQLKALPLEAISFRRGVSAKSYGAGRIEDMAASLGDTGMRDPVVVKQLPGKDNLVLVTGGCRLLAARKLGWKTLPALVLDGAYGVEIKLLEALRDDDLTPWDLSDHLHQLKYRLGWTQAHLGQAIGRTRDFVANMLSISQIAPETRQFILKQRNGGELTARHLRYVARAPEHRQMHLARRMLERELSTTALEQGKKTAAPKSHGFRPSNLRSLPAPDSPAFPRTAKEWKKHQRRLTTDLRRVNRREALEQNRIQSAISEARLRQRMVKQEAQTLRRELQRELRRTRRELEG